MKAIGEEGDGVKVFISYSHRDEAMLERLHAHLAMLRREGGISEWFDRKITAGQSIDQAVEKELERCDVFLALVSPDFLNSGYCYEKEMGRAIERSATGAVDIVPVILEPCDWQSSPFKEYKAIPKDGKPVSEWVNKNAAWLDVVGELRRFVENHKLQARESTKPMGRPAEKSTSPRNSPTYRVKKTFDQIDREDFGHQSFEKIRQFFEESCKEIDGLEDLRARYTSMGSSAFSCTIVNRLIKTGRGGTAHITVRQGSGTILGDISWSFTQNAAANTANGGYTIEADDYHQYLKGSFTFGGDERREWSPEEASNYLWQAFIEQAGISI